MKTALLLLGLAVVALSPAQAQVFRPHSFGNRGAWHGPNHGWGYGGGPRWSVNLGFGPAYYWAHP
jgi:opacity protein-like surface antigen